MPHDATLADEAGHADAAPAAELALPLRDARQISERSAALFAPAAARVISFDNHVNVAQSVSQRSQRHGARNSVRVRVIYFAPGGRSYAARNAADEDAFAVNRRLQMLRHAWRVTLPRHARFCGVRE